MCGGEQEAAAPTPAASAVASGDVGPAAEGGSKLRGNAAEHALPAELANGAEWAAIAKGEAQVMQGGAPGTSALPVVGVLCLLLQTHLRHYLDAWWQGAQWCISGGGAPL